jgi:hypothetical protein
MASGYSARANRRKIKCRGIFFVASPGEGLNEFGYVTGAIEDRVIHLASSMATS